MTPVQISADAAVPACVNGVAGQVMLDSPPSRWLSDGDSFPYTIPDGQTLWITSITLSSKHIQYPFAYNIYGPPNAGGVLYQANPLSVPNISVPSYRNSGAVMLICDLDGVTVRGGLPTVGDHHPQWVFPNPIFVIGPKKLMNGHFDNMCPEPQNMTLVIAGWLQPTV